jgi:outer membrane protein
MKRSPRREIPFPVALHTAARAAVVLLGLGLVAPRPCPAETAPSRRDGRIAVLVDGPSDRVSRVLDLAREELGRFGYEATTFPSDKVRIGDFSFDTAREQLDQALADPDVDVIWAFGPVSSAAAVQMATTDELTKPVLAPFVLGPSARLLESKPTPNLAYVVWTPSLAHDLQVLRAFRPVQTLAYLIPDSIRRAMPGAEATLRAETEALGVELRVVSGPDAAAAVRALPADVDAVLVGPDPQRTPADLEALARALIERGLPSFSQLGRLEVERGLLVGVGTSENALRLARAIAVNTDAILQGEAPDGLDYAMQRVDRPVVNLVTAQALGLQLSWTVLSEAEGIGKERLEDVKTIGLEDVVREVREQNFQLRASTEEVEAADRSVNEALGAFMPAVDASVTAAWRDPDGATGANPEQSLSWSGNASQPLINEPVLAQFAINRHRRDAARSDNRTVTLDLTRSAAVAYLNLLRAIATERIQRDNLAVTRTELEQAGLRQDVGVGARSEVVRLQTQLANNRATVIDAIASRKVAEIELRRLLNSSSEEPIVPEDLSLESSRLMGAGDRLQSYMEGPDRFALLRQFMAEEAARNSPELAANERRLAAQRRQALSAQLAPFVPTVGLSGGVTHIFAADGAGTGDEGLPFLTLNEFNWQAGVTASLRVFEGGTRNARTQREKATARSQAFSLESQRIQIEANVRSALHRAAASYAAIALLQDAADAADENLSLVQQRYARGKDNIITLVDAQNQALTSRLSANTAVYDHLVDLTEVQRALGRFEFSMSEQVLEDFFARLRAFAAAEEQSR